MIVNLTYKNNVFSAFFSANETHEKHARDYHITTELVAKRQQSGVVQLRALALKQCALTFKTHYKIYCCFNIDSLS